MTTIDPNLVDTNLAQGLRERAADLGDEDQFYEQVLATIAILPQRRSFHAWPTWFGRRTILVLGVVALLGLVAASLVAGGFLRPPAPPIPAFWTATGGMIEGRSMHTATLLPDGTVLVAGGGTDPEPDAAELYDPATGSWTATGTMAGRSGHTATLLLDGRVLVAGGFDSDNGRLATADLYDPSTRSWTATPNMIEARFEHTATLLPDGRVLVAGGADRDTAELYDPRSGTWTATGRMVTQHNYQTATLLRDGTVLVVGDPGSAELYDPRTGTWTATGPMIQGGFDYTATMLPDGRVLVAGDGRSAELYDPRTGTWTATGSLIRAHAQHAATLLPDGAVLVTGGGDGIVDGDDPAVAFVEVYDPSLGRWTAAPDMDAARRLHTSTLLPDGTVLVAGGEGDTGASTSAELYHPGSMPAVVPPPSPLLSAEPSSAPVVEPSSAPVVGRIVYTKWRTLAGGEEDCTSRFAGFCRHASVVISNDDGSGERELFPEPSSIVLAASSDGTKLIVTVGDADGDRVFLTDADGSEPKPLDTHCQTPCLGDRGFTLSADGSRLAFNRTRSGVPGPSGEDLVVATMDMTTGTVVELESTHDNWARPGLSPDGSRVAFGNHVVDADGSNLQQIAPVDLFTDEQFGVFSAGLAPPQWSPDGSLIAFASFNATVPNANLQALMEIYVVRPDGSGLQRLTTDTDRPRGGEEVGDFGANFPTWTSDGRIAFTRYPAREEDLFELWVMDADGSNATRVDESNAAALTALECVSCPYPGRTRHEAASPSFAFWIPAR